MTRSEDLARDYRAAFLRYLPRRGEAAMHTGYQLGRSAVADGVSILELAEVHHEVVLDVLRATRVDDVINVATAASEFLLETLAPYDMTHRGFLDGS